MNNKSQYEKPCEAYSIVIGDYRRNFDLYHGGSFMEGAHAKKYIAQRELERDTKYERRIRQAAYRNYAAPTVDMFASSIFDGVERIGLSEIDVFEPVLLNCNKSGDTPDKFFKGVASSAAAIGAHFVLVDNPSPPTSEEGVPVLSMTYAERNKYRYFPYFVSIPAENLISWRIDPDDQHFDFVVFLTIGRDFEDGPFSREIEIRTVTMWNRREWRNFTSRGGGDYSEVGSGANALGVVPVVPFFYEKHPNIENVGISAIDDVAALLIRLYNMDSERGEYCSDCALPVNILSGISQDEAEGAYKASDALWCFKDANAKLDIKEPSGASYTSLSTEADNILNSIREISLRQTKPRGAQVESAEAKRLDSVQISSQLAEFARNAAASERRCWELAGLLAGVEQTRLDAITIKYNGTFDPDALREKLAESYMELRKNGDISRETVWRHLGMTDEQVDDEKARLDEESRAGSGPSGNLAGAMTAIFRDREGI